MIRMIQIYGRNLARQIKALPFLGSSAAPRSMRIRLDDGTPVRLRPARPADSAAVLAMHRRLSRTSLFFRYLRLYTPTLADIEAICSLGGKEGLALVAIIGEKNPSVAGLAYLAMEKDRLTATAEPAIVIEDRFHGRGLGRRLFAQLCRMARQHDIAVLHTWVHKENRKMQRILKHLEYHRVQKCHADMVEAEIILNPTADFGWPPPELAGFDGHAMTECSL